MLVQLECFNCGVVIEQLEVVKKHRGFPRRPFRIISVCCDCVVQAQTKFESDEHTRKLERAQALPL